MNDLKNCIKTEAERLGFALLGVTNAQPMQGFPRYKAWLAHGYQAEMHFLSSEHTVEMRQDVRNLFPQCQSILVLGVSYPLELSFTPDFVGRGRIAAYAWGEDYHITLPPMLHALAAFIQDKVGDVFPYRAYTDTGALLERELAMRSGLGWIGKNGCLINPQFGSALLLAELLLPIPLEADAPFSTDRCGSCTRCVDACPSACILPNRTLDARRCVAYLTIEHRDEIPNAYRQKLGDWVFGCDVCQMVCPWNSRSQRSSINHNNYPLLLDELELTQEMFSMKYKNSAVSRAKRRGYLRNVAVALGNQAFLVGGMDEQTIRALKDILEREEDALVREHAAWVLANQILH